MDISAFAKTHWLSLSLAGLGLMCLVGGLMSFSGQSQPDSGMRFDSTKIEQGKDSQHGEGTASTKQITVDVEGAVQKPGVYRLPADSLVKDALLKAGGMSDKADRTQVAKAVNLAAKLSDGTKLYIPFQGETVQSAGGEILGDSVGSAHATGVVNINTASQKEIESLPGVGEVTAVKIIDGRPYGSIEELLSKKVLGQKLFEEIKAKLVVY